MSGSRPRVLNRHVSEASLENSMEQESNGAVMLYCRVNQFPRLRHSSTRSAISLMEIVISESWGVGIPNYGGIVIPPLM